MRRVLVPLFHEGGIPAAGEIKLGRPARSAEMQRAHGLNEFLPMRSSSGGRAEALKTCGGAPPLGKGIKKFWRGAGADAGEGVRHPGTPPPGTKGVGPAP